MLLKEYLLENSSENYQNEIENATLVVRPFDMLAMYDHIESKLSREKERFLLENEITGNSAELSDEQNLYLKTYWHGLITNVPMNWSLNLSDGNSDNKVRKKYDFSEVEVDVVKYGCSLMNRLLALYILKNHAGSWDGVLGRFAAEVVTSIIKANDVETLMNILCDANLLIDDGKPQYDVNDLLPKFTNFAVGIVKNDDVSPIYHSMKTTLFAMASAMSD